MLRSYNINPLNNKDIDGVITLSNLLLGKDYLTPSLLQEYLANDNKIAFVVKAENQIIGFLLIQICDPKEVTSLALTEKEWFSNLFNNYPLGVIKTIAIHPNYKQQGIGTALTKKGVEKLTKSCEKIISICWNQKEATSFNFVLEKCGLQNLKEIKNFWKNDSLTKEYNCPICGDPPCVCSAFIYEN